MINEIKGLPPFMNKITETDIKSLLSQELGKPNSEGDNSLTINSKNEQNTTPASLQAKQENSGGTVDYSKLADSINQAVGTDKSRLEFTLDKESEKMILKIIDNETNEVVRQLPPEITLKIARMVALILEEKGQVTNARV